MQEKDIENLKKSRQRWKEKAKAYRKRMRNLENLVRYYRAKNDSHTR
jgi:hypothetical protein